MSLNHNVRACARCRSELGLIMNRGAICRSCQLRVCKSCREYNLQATQWVCNVCHKESELRIATGEWMQDFVRRNSQRREKVFVPAAELVKKSIKRSWTISNPSGTARPPPIERFRRLPDVDNPSNSLPRIASKMAKDNNTYVASTYTLPPPPRSQSEEGRAMRPRRPRAMSLASEEYYARSQSEDSRRFDAGGEDSDGSSLFRPSRPQPRPPQHSPSFRSVQGPYSDDERFPRYAPPPHLRNRVEFLPNSPSRTQSEERPPVRKGVVRGSSFSLPRPAYDPASPTLRPPKPPRAHPPTVKRRASTSNLSEVARRNSHRSPPSIRHSGTEDTFESDASASSFSPTRRRRETVILREEFQARKEALLFQAQGSISTDEDPIYDRPVMPPRKRTPPPIAKRRSESFKELSHALRRRSSSASDSEEPSRNRARDRAKEIRRRESLSGPPPSNYRTELAVNLTVETCGPDSTAPASDSKPPRSTSSSSNASPRVHAAPAIVTTSAPDSSPDDSSSGRRKSKRDAQIDPASRLQSSHHYGSLDRSIIRSQEKTVISVRPETSGAQPNSLGRSKFKKHVNDQFSSSSLDRRAVPRSRSEGERPTSAIEKPKRKAPNPRPSGYTAGNSDTESTGSSRRSYERGRGGGSSSGCSSGVERRIRQQRLATLEAGVVGAEDQSSLLDQSSTSDIHLDSQKIMPEGDDYKIVFISSSGGESSTAELNSSVEDSVNRLHPPAGGSSGEGSFMEEREWEAFDSERRFRKHFPAPSTGRVKNSIFHQREHYFSDLTAEVLACSPKITRRPTAHDKDSHRLRDGLSLSPHRGGGDAHSLGSSGASLGSPRRSLSDADIHDLCERVSSEELDTGSSAGSTSSRSPEAEIEATSENGTRIIIRKKESGIRSGKPRSISPHPLDTKRHSPPGQAYDYCTSPMDQNQHGMPAEPTKPYYEVRNASTQLEADECVKIHINSKTSSKSQGYPSMGSSPTSSSELGSARGERPEPTGASTDSDSSTHDDDLKRQMVEMGVQTEDVASSSSSSAPIEDLDDSYSSIPPMKPVRLNPCNGRKRSEAYTENYSVSDDALSLPPSTISEFDSPPRDIPSGFDDASSMRPSSSRSSRSSLSSASSVREVSKEPSPDVPQLPVTPQSVSVQLDPMAVQRSSRESSVSSIHNMSSEDDTSLSTQMAVLDDDVFSDFHTNTADEAELGDEAADGHPSWLKLSDEDWKMFKYQERLAALQDDEGTSDGRLSDDDDFPLRKRHDDIPLAYDSETDDGILDGAATTGETRDGPGAETLERDQPRRKVRPGDPTSKPLAMERRLRPSPERRTKAAAGVLKESKSAAFDDELSAGSSARKRSGGILRESPPRKSPPQTPTRSKIPVPVKALGKEEAYLNRSRPDLTLNDIANEVLFDVGVSSSVSASSDVESDSEAGFFHPTSESDFDDPALTPTPGMTREGGVQLVTPTKGVTVIQIDANGKKKITEPQTVTTLRVGESPSSSEIEEESSEEERRRHESVTSELEALIAKTRRARLEFEAQQAAGVRLARRGPVNLPTVVPVAQQRHRRDDVMIEEDVLPEDEAGSFSSYDQFDGERNPYYVEEHPSDGSWTEDEQYSDVYESQSSGDEMYFDREEDLRGYNRTIDFTLHTIMEESCEESETASMKLRTPTPASSLTRRDSDISRGDANPDLEKYLVAGSDKASSPPTESIMSETSFFSEGNEDVSPEDLASTRLEKYFRSAFPVGPDGFVRPQDDVSDGSSVGEGGSNSVGSESDGQPSPERKRKKVMKSRNRRGSVENLLNRSSRSEGIYSDVSGAHSADEAGELSEFSCNGELRSSSSGRILSSEEEEITAFDKSDGQFDTIKRRKKKRPESASDSERKEKEFDLKRTSEAEDEYKVATVTMQLQHSSRKNRDSGFLGSSDDLLKSSISNEESGKRSMDPSTVSATPGEPQADSGKSSPADNADGDDPDGEKRAADCESSPSQGHKQVVRKDSFYNWSSDEETNLMMNRMRAFFKNLVSGTGKVGEQRVKPPRLLEFEEKLTNLMKTVPGIKDEQVKEIVEYLSSEDTWSDSYDSSDYTSSDLEGALQHQFDLQAVQGNPVLQEQISASCKEIIQKFESSNTKEQSDGDRDSPHSLSKETAFVYHRLVTSINKMTSESADTKSPAPQSSPPLIAKVMQHIGTRLVALMHEVSAPESHSSSRTPQLLSAKMLRPGIAQNRILEASDEDDTPKASPSSTLKTPLSSNTTPRASPYSTLKPEVPASAKSALELGREALLGEGITLNPTEQPEQGAGARKRLFPLEQRKHHLSLEKIFDANGQPTADGRWNKSASCDNLIDKPSPSGEGVDQTPSPSSYRPSWMEDRKPVSRLEKPLSWLTKGKRMKTKSNERLCAPITPPYRPSAPGFPSATRLQSTGTPENDDYSNKASVYGFMASGANRSTRSLEGFALRRRSEEIAASARSIDDRRKLSAAPQTPPPASTPSSGSGSPNVSARFRPSPERGVVGSTRSQSTSTSKAAFNKRADALSEELRSLTPPLKGRGGSGNALGIPHSNSSSAFPISGDETDDPERFTPKLYAPPNRISISPARSVASASSTEATPSSSLATTPSSSILNLASAPSQIPVRGEVELSLQYNTQGKSLDVFVRACRDLAAVDTRRHRSDPYVKAYLLPDRTKTGKRKTKVRKHTLNPVFEEILRFPGTLEDLKSRTLWVSVWHQDMFGRNDFLGEISLPLAGQDLADPSNKWFPLKERQFLAHMEEIAPQVSSAGRLLVALQYQPRSAVVHVNEMKKELGKLCVLVKEGRDLGTSGHPMDSFVKCCLLPEKSNKQKSSTVKRTRNPVWNHSFIFEGISLLDLADRALEISVWEADRLSSSLIGTLRCSLGSGLHNGKSVDWMDATGEERDLWQRMIDRPRFWVQECLTLKTSSDRS